MVKCTPLISERLWARTLCGEFHCVTEKEYIPLQNMIKADKLSTQANKNQNYPQKAFQMSKPCPLWSLNQPLNTASKIKKLNIDALPENIAADAYMSNWELLEYVIVRKATCLLPLFHSEHVEHYPQLAWLRKPPFLLHQLMING